VLIRNKLLEIRRVDINAFKTLTKKQRKLLEDMK